MLKTTRHLTSLAIVRNGEGRQLPAFARLKRTECTPGYGVSRTGYVNYNGADWFRNIVNIPDKWFLVIDEVTAREPGDYCLESRWALPACCAFDGDDLVSAQYRENEEGTVFFRLHDKFFRDGQVPHHVSLTVTYLDRGRGRWSLCYNNGTSKATARTVRCEDSGSWKRISLHLDDAHFNRDLERNSDLTIKHIDGEDTLFHMLELHRR